MIYLFYTLHILVCIFLILVVLLQQGKGADLSVFGGGSTQTAFGARGAATLLHKLTVISFVLFIVTTMGIAVLSGGARSASVMSEALEEQVEDKTLPDADEQGTGTDVPLDDPADQVEPLDDLVETPAERGDLPPEEPETPAP